MFRRLFFVFCILALTGIALPSTGYFTGGAFVGTAQAQDAKPKRKNLLELLFGDFRKKNAAKNATSAPNAAKRVDVNKPKSKKSKKSPSGSATASGGSSSAAGVAAVVATTVEKAEDASKVLVIGDFMASQLSDGLVRQFASNPGIVIVDGAVSLSGMVRDDVRDWPGTISAMIDEEKPVAVIALVGMNDRQLISTAEGRVDKLTDGWNSIYEARTDSLAKTIREKRVPLIWVGLPPVDKTSMNADYLQFNEMYRKAVEAYGGLYVDVWDGYVDTEGRYMRSGPDVNGQIVALRRADGINMTDSGEDKLAFYAEKAVKKMTGFSRDSLVASLGSVSDLSGSNEPQYDPVGTGRTINIALGGPAIDGGNVLEGAEGFLVESDAKSSVSYDLVAKGLASQPRSGRVDAGWGLPSFQLARDETPEPVLANMRGISLKPFLEELPVVAEPETKAPAAN